MGPIGIPELILVLVILLVIFGPKRLPGLGRSLGSGMKEFKDSVTGDSKHDDDDDAPRELTAAPQPIPTVQSTAATPEPQPAERASEAPASSAEPRA